MRIIIFSIALTLLGLSWMGEKFSANRTAAEIIRLRRQHAELASLLRERERLAQRRDEAERRRNAALEQAELGQPASIGEREAAHRTAMPLGDWVAVTGCRFRGQATPQASIESALWAAAGGDTVALKQFLLIPDETRKAATAMLASLPATSPLAYQGPDDLISALTINRIPLGEAQLVWLNQKDADHATACVFIKDPPDPGSASGPTPGSQDEGPTAQQVALEKKPVSSYLALQREGNRWLLVVPPTATH